MDTITYYMANRQRNQITLSDQLRSNPYQHQPEPISVFPSQNSAIQRKTRPPNPVSSRRKSLRDLSKLTAKQTMLVRQPDLYSTARTLIPKRTTSRKVLEGKKQSILSYQKDGDHISHSRVSMLDKIHL